MLFYEEIWEWNENTELTDLIPADFNIYEKIQYFNRAIWDIHRNILSAFFKYSYSTLIDWQNMQKPINVF